MPYVALQQLLDEANGWGQHNYEKSCFLPDITDEAIDVIMEQLPGKNSPLSVLLFYRLDAAFTEVGEDDTAFGGGRSPRYGTFLLAVAPDPALLPPERAWVRSFWEALRPVALGNTAYVNAMTEYEKDRVLATYGTAKYERLAVIKAAYDPANVFHRNINIKPT